MTTLDSLDLNLLLVFDALLRTRSVTAAAERMGMGQSSMSGALKRLRVALDDPLFVKTAAGMTPTALALQLAGPVQAGITQIRGALESRNHFDPATSSRRFTLYLSDTGQLLLLPPLLAAIRREAPGIRLQTLQVDVRDARRLMAEGGIDLALGYFVNLDDNLHRSLLFRNEYVCIASAHHPTLLDERACTLTAFGEAPHLVYRPAVGSHWEIDERITALCAREGVPRRVVLQVSHALGLSDMIASSDLIACVPRVLAEWSAQRSAIRIFPLPVSLPSVEISQYWAERSHRDAGLVWLRHLIRTLLTPPEPGA